MSQVSVSPPRGPTIIGGVLSLICLVILLWLGAWQVQRLKWKENILNHVAALKSDPAGHPLAAVLASGDTDFVRVAFDCADLMSRPRLRLYGVQGGQTGYRLMAACPVQAAGVSSVLVDLGFEGQSLNADTPAPCLKTPSPKPLTGPAVGILRHPDPRTFVTPPDDAQQNMWFSRDLPAMAKALGVGAPAPAFVALEQSPGAALDACPVARTPIPSDLPNNHLQYAITWFGLAAALVGVYAAMLFRKRPT